MNLFKYMCGGVGLAVKTEVIHKKLFLWINAKPFGIKAMAVVVLLPYLVESAFAKVVEIALKDSSSLIMSLERFDKDVTDSFSSARALEYGNFGSESGYKFLGSSTKGISMPEVKGNNGGDNAAKNSSFWSSNSHDEFMVCYWDNSVFMANILGYELKH
ncbi:MAG: hypothetical protein ACXV9R_14560 [Methylobacter sp.]